MKHTRVVVALLALLAAGLSVGCGDLASPTGIPLEESPQDLKLRQREPCPAGTPLWPTRGDCIPQAPPELPEQAPPKLPE